MTEQHLPWENPNQDYKRTLMKRRSERRYRVLQLTKTLRVSLTRLKLLGIDEYNVEILTWIEQMEDGSAADFDDEEFTKAKRFTKRIVKLLEKIENKSNQG
ncbi:MAG: hypothetical protein FWH31_00760 [Streptococcaceae bacterium]|nr:hypothetical protein [Streptococcaceae bacterium]